MSVAAANIIPQDLGTRLAHSFLQYSRYVIGDRALPDIRDGLKPVQRRILFSMNNLGLAPNKSFKKSALTVGDVIGKYHPHGDQSVYDAMVKMAQDFNMRYPLVHGHGNFGSVDGDSPAAMRYTESKLSTTGDLMLIDLNKNTVGFEPNYDESLEEPEVLPTFFPNLLANGTTGIAVGMGTSIPPHNVADIYKALLFMIDNELKSAETDIDDLIDIVKAPDFPTGGIIINPKTIHDGYRNGLEGKVVIRSKYEIEENKGRTSIVITEIPYKVNKARLIEKIAELCRDKVLEGISDLRDESNKEGIRVVIELTKDTNPQWVIKKLLKSTDLQCTFPMNLIALVGKRPYVFNLKEALEHFLVHVAKVIMNRTQFDLDKAEKRKHIVEGILICLSNLDEVVAVIRATKVQSKVIQVLQDSFGLTKEQAKAVEDMRLARLSAASEEEFDAERQELTEIIARYNEILTDEKTLLSLIRSELSAIAERFTGPRKTEISFDSDDDSITERDLVKEEELVVTFTAKGIVKSVSASEYSVKGRRTKGTKGATIKDDDSVKFILTVNSRDDLLFITNKGRCHVLPAYKIPVSGRTTVGKYISNYLLLEVGETIVSLLSRDPVNDHGDMLFVTRKGIGKRLSLDDLSTRLSITKVLTFKDDDELVTCSLLKPPQEVLVLTAKGYGIRFNPDSEAKGIRRMGRQAAGVKVAGLTKDDYVVDAVVVDGESFLLMTELGYSKRVAFEGINTIGRGSKGVRICVINEKTGAVVGMVPVNDDDELFIATRNGQLSRISVKDIRVMGRTAVGVRTITLSEDDTVVSVSKNTADDEA